MDSLRLSYDFDVTNVKRSMKANLNEQKVDKDTNLIDRAEDINAMLSNNEVLNLENLQIPSIESMELVDHPDLSTAYLDFNQYVKDNNINVLKNNNAATFHLTPSIISSIYSNQQEISNNYNTKLNKQNLNENLADNKNNDKLLDSNLRLKNHLQAAPNSLPLIEAPLSMSNPFYRIFRKAGHYLNVFATH